jgi:hypothetical protein
MSGTYHHENPFAEVEERVLRLIVLTGGVIGTA